MVLASRMLMSSSWPGRSSPASSTRGGKTARALGCPGFGLSGVTVPGAFVGVLLSTGSPAQAVPVQVARIGARLLSDLVKRNQG